MALQMTDRLDNLYVAAMDRGASLMHANAVSATARWCNAKTTHAQVQDFVERQISSLEGLNDSLSVEIRQSWQWLADELGAAPAVAAEPARVFRFARRERETATVGARAAA
jgi:hypothetical protein